MQHLNKSNEFKVQDIAIISVLTAILFVQEQILTFIPNVQLTFFLIILFSKKLRFIHNFCILTIYVIIDGIMTSSLGLLYTPFIFISLLLIPISLKTIFKNVNHPTILAFLGIGFSLIYCWLFIIPFVIILQTNFFVYMTQDIIYEVVLASSTFITTLVLYKPISSLFDSLINRKLNHK